MSCNKYTNMFEPLRGDNRDFTDYRSNHIINDELESVLKCKNKDFKFSLINNSDKIIKIINDINFNKNGTYNCK